MRPHGARKILPLLQAGLIGLCLVSLAGAAVESPALETVVTVVALNEQGEPLDTALGVIIRQDGLILTSAAIFQPGQPLLVKTDHGAIYWCQSLLYADLLQDLAVLKIEATGLKAVPLQASKRSHVVEEKIYYPIKEGNKYTLREGNLVGSLPLSPRLELLKLSPCNQRGIQGTPVFNRTGEVVGMMHLGGDQNEGPQGKPTALNYFLSCDRTLVPISLDAASLKGTKPAAEPRGDLSGENPANALVRAFWDGVAATIGNNWELAQKKFSLAMAPPAQLPEAYYGRGVSRFHLRNYQGATEDLLEATRRLPGYALAFFWLGKTWQQSGDQEAADAAYRQAVGLAPDLHEAWFYLGEIAYQRGDQDKAQKCLEKAEGDLPQAAMRAWYLGNIARSQQRLPEALAAFKQAVQMDPKYFPGYLEGGKLLLLDLGESREAVGWLGQAVSLKPQHAEARYFLSLAYHLSWNAAAAWEQCYALEKIQPDLAGQLATVLARGQ
ncbi:MAG: tetratricopeptide repeat-containing serine protease family protein [Desulfobaccales bacterium]